MSSESLTDKLLPKRACPGCGGATAPWWPGKGTLRAGHSVERCMKCGGVLATESAIAELYGIADCKIDPKTGLAWLPKERLAKLTLVGEQTPIGGAVSDELGAEDPPDPLGAIAADHGLPFVEGAPEIHVAPWMTRFTIATILLAGMLCRIRPGWGDALELSRDHRGISHFLTYAWIPSRQPAVALADLYCLFLFGAEAEDALGTAGFIGLYLSACALGGILTLPFDTEPLRGFTSAAAALSAYFCLSFPRARIGFRLGLPGRRSPLDSWVRLPPIVWLFTWYLMQLFFRLWFMPDVPQQRDFTAPLAAWGAGVLVGVVAWAVSKLTSSVQSTT